MVSTAVYSLLLTESNLLKAEGDSRHKRRDGQKYEPAPAGGEILGLYPCYPVDTTKLTLLQENFSQCIVDGLNQSDAYKAAGYSIENKLPATVHQAASRLAGESKVLARIQELRDRITAGKVWSFAKGMDEVETIMTMARDKGQIAAAIRGTEQALKLSGLLTERPPDQVAVTKVTSC